MKEQIRGLRAKTGAGMFDCKKALEETHGDIEKALEILLLELESKTNDKSNRETSEGIVAHYIHHNLQVGSIVVLKCETDFVAKNELFKKLAYDLALQIAAEDPSGLSELLNQQCMKNDSLTVEEYLEEIKIKIGENIVIDKFSRFEV